MTMKNFKRLLLFGGFFLQAIVSNAPYAAVNDIFPGDFYPQGPGTTNIALYAFERQQRGPYVQGAKLFDRKLNHSILALRLTQTERVGDTTVAGVLVLPWLRSNLSAAPQLNSPSTETRGLSDIRLGITVWLINDREHAHYLGLNSMLISPSGAYDSGLLINAGENRWKLVFGGGWQKDLMPQLLVELAPEIVFYGPNPEYMKTHRLEQRSSQALTGYLRYRLNQTFHLHAGLQTNYRGQTSIDGIQQNNAAGNRRIMAGINYLLPEQQQITLRFAHDNSIHNGFRTESEIALRYLKSF